VAKSLGISDGALAAWVKAAERDEAPGAPAIYERDPHSEALRANGLFVLTIAGDQVRAITRFDATAVTRCGFPRIVSQ
jgi:hypothetical protein